MLQKICCEHMTRWAKCSQPSFFKEGSVRHPMILPSALGRSCIKRKPNKPPNQILGWIVNTSFCLVCQQRSQWSTSIAFRIPFQPHPMNSSFCWSYPYPWCLSYQCKVMPKIIDTPDESSPLQSIAVQSRWYVQSWRAQVQWNGCNRSWWLVGDVWWLGS